jgi:hypothetical protein
MSDIFFLMIFSIAGVLEILHRFSWSLVAIVFSWLVYMSIGERKMEDRG